MVKRAREEHRSAIEWLNNHTDKDVDFFLLEIKLYQIGDSDIAVKFDVVEKPNNWSKGIKLSSSSSPILQARLEYWTAFNDYAFSNIVFTKAFNKTKAGTDHWMNLYIGSSTCHISLAQIRKYGHALVELYISDDKEFFQKLYSKKDEIEEELGFNLEWNELPDKKASRIITYKNVDFDNKADWKNQFDWLMLIALKMKKVFKKYL